MTEEKRKIRKLADQGRKILKDEDNADFTARNQLLEILDELDPSPKHEPGFIIFEDGTRGLVLSEDDGEFLGSDIVTEYGVFLQFEEAIEWEYAKNFENDKVSVCGYMDGDMPIIVGSDLPNGIGIKTDVGVYEICRRDRGIEVILNEKPVYRTGQVAVDIPQISADDFVEELVLKWHCIRDGKDYGAFPSVAKIATFELKDAHK